jgi:hypothetical protein
MRKTHLLAGAAVLAAGAAWLGLAHAWAAPAATAAAAEDGVAHAGAALPSASSSLSMLRSIETWLDATPDSIVLLVTGTALIGLAEGVRRRAA